jgi:glycosyltransferase involved in cell wall biosynthesis
MPRITIVTGAHLCRNPRVVKETDALAEAGHDVTVVGPILNDALAAIDDELLRMRTWKRAVSIDLRKRAGTPDRVRRRAGMEAVRLLGLQSPGALGYGVRTALRIVRRKKSDLTIGHQEVGLWVAWRMAQEGYRCAVDYEDWYSHDLPPDARAVRPVGLLERLEGAMLQQAAFTLAPSRAMAESIHDAASGSGRMPEVIYNAFPWSDREEIDGALRDRQSEERPSLHWVSQTLGRGRGLETLFDALHMVDAPVDVHLRGRSEEATREAFARRFPSDRGHQLFFHELVPPSELLSRIAEHDIGIATEMSEPPSRDTTVTNKILHYLLGGLAVVASDTRGQREVANRAFGAVELYRQGNADALAASIVSLIGCPERLQHAKSAALDAANRVFSWERQKARLLDIVEKVLAR